MSDQHVLLSADEIKQRYGLTMTEYFQYISILHCLKAELRDMIRQLPGYNQPTQNAPYLVQNDLKTSTSKGIYNKLVLKVIGRPTSERKLNTILNTQYTDQEWENIYKLPFLSTIETKLRSFQFKINHNIYYTNEKLYRDKLSDTLLCYFCNQDTDSILHLFVECPCVEDLWGFLNDFLNNALNLPPLQVAEKILGVHEKINSPQYDVVNHLTIIVKHFIHMCKHKNTRPSVPRLKEKIVDIERIERNISIRKNKLYIHDQ